MPPDITSLLDVANRAFLHAYAPYSKFKVGVALQAADGTIWQGANVEIASFGGTICAERSALMAAVSHGHRNFQRILILTDALTPTAPCGICRQALVEFSPQLIVISQTLSGAHKLWTLAELLPDYFGPSDLAQPGST